MGDKEKAKKLFIDVANLYPYTFHGIRAKEQLLKTGISLTKNNINNKGAQTPVKLGRALTPLEKFSHNRAIELSALGLTLSLIHI